MDAGRDLDRIVAEKIFGLTVKPIRVVDGRDITPDIGTVSEPYKMGDGRMGVEAKAIPAYSTEIADAWEVVRWMCEVHDFWMRLEYNEPTLTWLEFIQVNGPIFCAEAPTAPHAICLSALACVGVILPPARQTYPVGVDLSVSGPPTQKEN